MSRNWCKLKCGYCDCYNFDVYSGTIVCTAVSCALLVRAKELLLGRGVELVHRKDLPEGVPLHQGV